MNVRPPLQFQPTMLRVEGADVVGFRGDLPGFSRGTRSVRAWASPVQATKPGARANRPIDDGRHHGAQPAWTSRVGGQCDRSRRPRSQRPPAARRSAARPRATRSSKRASRLVPSLRSAVARSSAGRPRPSGTRVRRPGHRPARSRGRPHPELAVWFDEEGGAEQLARQDGAQGQVSDVRRRVIAEAHGTSGRWRLGSAGKALTAQAPRHG